MDDEIELRDVRDEDLDVFFEHQRDPVARHMAAFTSKDGNDRAAFDAHWAKIRNDETITNRTIVAGGAVIGSIGRFELDGKPNVTYWIGREYWGRGLATKALALSLDQIPTRPLYASVAGDNIGSRRVLEKCGFRVTGRERAFANARGAEIEEIFFRLD